MTEWDALVAEATAIGRELVEFKRALEAQRDFHALYAIASLQRRMDRLTHRLTEMRVAMQRD